MEKLGVNWTLLFLQIVHVVLLTSIVVVPIVFVARRRVRQRRGAIEARLAAIEASLAAIERHLAARSD